MQIAPGILQAVDSSKLETSAQQVEYYFPLYMDTIRQILVRAKNFVVLQVYSS